jgi:hypothetical protein
VQVSDFERAVVEELITEDAEAAVLFEQLAHAAVSDRNYSGVGVFVRLSISPEARRVRLDHPSPITGTNLTHPHLERGAMAILWLKNGLIECLEMFTHQEPWPTIEGSFQIERKTRESRVTH